MPASSPEPTAATGRQPMPTSARVAIALLALLGVLLLSIAALIWVQQEQYIDSLVAAGANRASAGQTALLWLVAYAVIGLSALLAALFLPRRRRWARQVGLLVTSLLVAITVLAALLTGAITPNSLLVLVAGVAGFASLYSRQTKDWLFGVPTS